MRWWGIIVFVVIAGAIFVAPYVLGDSFVEDLIEDQASYAVGAKVDIDNLVLDFPGVNVGWDRIQIADPEKTMTNALETGPVRFNVDFWTWWITGDIIIESFQVSGIKTGTPRATDGYIEIPEEEVIEEEDSEPGVVSKALSSVKKEVAGAAIAEFDEMNANVDVDALLKNLNLQSVQKADSLKNVITERADYWSDVANQSPIPAKVDEIEKKVNSIDVKELSSLSFDPKKLDDAKKIERAVKEVDQKIKDIDAAIKTVEQLQKDVKEVRSEAEKVKSNAEKDIRFIRSSPSDMQKWVKDDYQTAKNLAKLPELNAQNIGQALFGDTFTEQFASYLEYVEMAREYMGLLSSDTDENEADLNPAEERFGGVDITYSNKYHYPDMWIKSIQISGSLNDEFSLSGTISDIVSDQKFINKATIADITGTHSNGSTFNINGSFDYRSERQEIFRVSYSGIPLRDIRLSKSSLMPYSVKSGQGDVNAQLSFLNKVMDAEIAFEASDIVYDRSQATKKQNRFERLIDKSITSTNHITVNVDLEQNDGKTDFKLQSNLDEAFRKNLSGAINEEYAAARRKIEQEIDRRVASKRRELENLARKKEKEVRQKVDKAVADAMKDLGVDDLKNTLESKKREFEGKVKKDLEKAGKDLLKNTLGKFKF